MLWPSSERLGVQVSQPQSVRVFQKIWITKHSKRLSKIKSHHFKASLKPLLQLRRRLFLDERGNATSTGCDIHIDYPHSSPATNNDHQIVEMLWGAAEQVVGRDRVSLIEMPSLGGEDFAYYQQVVSGAMARLGTAFQDPNACFPLHAPEFDINESALVTGVRFLCRSSIHSIIE
ncbi:MAG: M20/M25/M40 family metallo-hydrolase, partial [Phycisphaerales bacterium]|nr:M20/M25/M40 family metallo-hydrolase [Phycisphaerales bacterium]